jgi:CrcB protein
MITYIYLAIGAVAGAFARYGLGTWVSGMQQGKSIFPWGTLLINLTGSLLLGFLMRYLVATPVSREMRLMLTTGFCGAYTTFSTFSYEAINLLMEGQTGEAFLYIGLSLLLGIALCYAGYLLGGAAL